jgi:hypothetical protein
MMAKKTKNFRNVIGGQSPAGVGATAGLNRNPFGKYGKTKYPQNQGTTGRSARKPQVPAPTDGYGIKVQKANTKSAVTMGTPKMRTLDKELGC